MTEPKSVHKTAKVGSYSWQSRKVSIKLLRSAVFKAPRGNLWKGSIELLRLAVLWAPRGNLRKVPIKLPRSAVLGAPIFILRKVSIKLPRLAVMHGRSEKCPYNCQRWQFLWLPVKLPALAVLSALFCVDKTASVGSFDGTFKTAVYGSCSKCKAVVLGSDNLKTKQFVFLKIANKLCCVFLQPQRWPILWQLWGTGNYRQMV